MVVGQLTQQGNINHSQLYASAVKVYDDAEREASEQANVLRNMYNRAVTKLGYTSRQLANNDDCQKEVLKLMFSDEIAGDSGINTLLGKSSLYKGYSGSLPEGKKASLHEAALGLDYNKALLIMRQYGIDTLDEQGMARISQAVKSGHTNTTVDNFLRTRIPAGMAAQKSAYAGLASQDPYIRRVDGATLDLDDLKQMAMKAITGTNSRSTLEDRVGVTLRERGRAVPHN